MEIEQITEKFSQAGLSITPQAAGMIKKLEGADARVEEIIRQAKARSFKIAGGDVLKFIITGTVSDIIRNAEDVR